MQTLIRVVIGVCWIVGRASGVRSCHRVFCVQKLPFANVDNLDSHFYVGNPHLACRCRSVPKFAEICVHVMSVATKECSRLCLHELFDLTV